MTGPVPPAALAAARAAVPFVNEGACRRILEAGAPAIEAAAAAAEAERWAHKSADIAAKAHAAERERCALLAEEHRATWLEPCDADDHERGRACREPGVHEVQMDGKRLRLCERHVRPEFHPPDLHKKLPGAVKRVLRNYGGRA